MKKIICRRATTVQFWDGYAKWYKLWIEHTNYHDRIIEVLTTVVEPGWKVLDIGAGNGVLSLPLCAIGCDVTVLEPSIGMRNLLFEEAFKRGIDWFKIDERRWEDIPVFEIKGYDLIMACNSLHLTESGFKSSVEKIFNAKPKNVFVVSELCSPEIRVKWRYGDYTMLFTKCYESESSFAYHHLEEVFEHWTFKKGHALCPDEKMKIKSKLIFKNGHFWIEDYARIEMSWWCIN
jgi:ubiquinone/menaquinone biosynthesis C-methylase UbiE